MSVPEVVGLALDMPRVFLQMAYDAELVASREAQAEKGWRRRGEKAVDARDRLRDGREEAKRRLGVG